MSQGYIFLKNPSPPNDFMIKENKYKIRYYKATLFILFDTFNPNINLFSPIQRNKPITFFYFWILKEKYFLRGGEEEEEEYDFSRKYTLYTSIINSLKTYEF